MHTKRLQYSEQKNAFFIYASLSLNTYMFLHTDIHNLINKVHAFVKMCNLDTLLFDIF